MAPKVKIKEALQSGDEALSLKKVAEEKQCSQSCIRYNIAVGKLPEPFRLLWRNGKSTPFFLRSQIADWTPTKGGGSESSDSPQTSRSRRRARSS